MTKMKINILLLSAASLILLHGCALKKMVKNVHKINYEVNPNPLEMHGDSVAFLIRGQLPGKFFNKKATIEITPVLSYGDEEMELQKIFLKGESIEEPGIEIPYSRGGTFKYQQKLPYSNELKNCKLSIKSSVSLKDKSEEFPVIDIAVGTIITPFLVQHDEKVIFAKDEFKKSKNLEYKGAIYFLVNQSTLRKSELTGVHITALKDFLRRCKEKKYALKRIEVLGYASPEGEVALNQNLSENRSKVSSQHLLSLLKQNDLIPENGDDLIKESSLGEDWNGFYNLMNESGIEDKELILRRLEEKKNVNEKEAELKNLTLTYVDIEKKVLSRLRRTEIMIRTDAKSGSDEDLSTQETPSSESLTGEELLRYAASTKDLQAKGNIYNEFINRYPSDWRGPNNLGCTHFQDNKLAKAEESFNKAKNLTSDNAIINNNLGVIKSKKGDRAGAESLFKSATGAGSEVNYNIGILDIQKGEYSDAVGNFVGICTFNSALAFVLNKDTEKAFQTVDCSADRETALGHYLKAVISARTKNKDIVISNLKSAIEEDGKYRDMAREDVEFRMYRGDADFKLLVGTAN